MDTQQCEQACCDSANCGMWQESPGRGCYFTADVKSVGCDDKAVARYEGGRKCVTGFCGGMEDLILGKLGGTRKKSS